MSEQQIRGSSFRSTSSNLDLIRAVAVLCVFFGHLVDICSGRSSEMTWHFAQMGVLIFFVHTSLVLMLSLERSAMKSGDDDLFRNFYLRRLFRLYPLAIVCVLIGYVTNATPDSHAIRHWNPEELLSNLTLTTNLTYSDNMVGGLWTLPLEMQMYLLLPFLFLFARKRAMGWLFGVLALLIPLAILQPRLCGRLNVIAYAPCFISGVIAWRLSLCGKRCIKASFWPMTFASLWLIFLLASRQNSMFFRWAFCFCLGVAIPWFKEITWKPIVGPAAVIAKYSYGIYLSHIALILFVFHLHVSKSAQWGLFALCMISCPLAMFHLVEQPFMRLGQRIIEPSPEPLAALADPIAETPSN